MKRTLPLLSPLRAFEAAGRLNSMSLAADEIGRTHGAVSRQIQTLADDIGAPLFDHVGNGVRLNERGQMLHRYVSSAFDLLEEGLRRVQAENTSTHVQVSCSATFAMRWLVPRLGEFYRLHPTVTVHLTMGGFEQGPREQFDIRVSWDRLTKSSYNETNVRKLADVAFGLVCAPNYPLEMKGNHLTIPNRISNETAPEAAWAAWAEVMHKTIDWGTELTFPHTSLCIEAALAGLGATIVEYRLVSKELAAGTLLAPCGFHRFEDGFFVLVTPSAARKAAAEAFLEWMEQALQADPVP